MSGAVRRVVFDCNTLLQALASPAGPAGRCVQLAMDGLLLAFLSPTVLEELADVAARPRVAAKLRITPDRFGDFAEALEAAFVLLSNFPEPFELPRDPDDAHYVNLALAAGAELIVSRDADLLDLMDEHVAGSAEFHSRFPNLRILSPVALLRELANAE